MYCKIKIYNERFECNQLFFRFICRLGEIPKLQYPNDDDAAKMHKSYIPAKHNNANYKENRHLFSQWKRNSQHFYFGVSLQLKKIGILSTDIVGQATFI